MIQIVGVVKLKIKMNIEQLIKYLEQFPKKAELVETNSSAWFSKDIYKLTDEEVKDRFQVVENPTIKGKSIRKKITYVSIHDRRKADY